MDTIFKKIIDREIPAEIVYEDDVVLVFLDNNPVHPGHTLVVPKAHCTNALDAPPETLAHMMRVGQRVAQAIKHELRADGVNLIMNNGAASGQEVFHAHLHVVPRYENDSSYSKPNKRPYEPGEAERVQETLRSALSTSTPSS